MEVIDWKALTQALVKRLAEVTPTATITNRYSASKSSKCPRCHTDDETIDHVIRCSSEACITWRSALLTHLTSLALGVSGRPFGWAQLLVSTRDIGLQ
jgi:aspartate carbamoyltransferase regulatory subunit